MFSKGPASSGDPRWQQQYRTSERHSKTRVFGSDPKHWKTYLPSSIHQRPTQKHSKTRRVFGFDDQKHVFLGLNKNTEKHFLPSRVVIYTPKEAHNRIFVTGGSVIAWQMLAKKMLFLGRPACIICWIKIYNICSYIYINIIWIFWILYRVRGNHKVVAQSLRPPPGPLITYSLASSSSIPKVHYKQPEVHC